MRTFHEIACEIRKVWTKVSPFALPYLDAMSQIYSSDKHARYWYEDAETQVIYFLANAQGWRGEDAKRIKAELRSMLA